jgi:hypothetical protein
VPGGGPQAVPRGVHLLLPPLLDALAKLDRDIFCVIEQDLYPVQPNVPLPIAPAASVEEFPG